MMTVKVKRVIVVSFGGELSFLPWTTGPTVIRFINPRTVGLFVGTAAADLRYGTILL